MSTFRLKSRRHEPPGRWVYHLTLPTGKERRIGPAHSFDHLVKLVREQSAKVGTPDPGATLIESQICAKTKFNGCEKIGAAGNEPMSEPTNPRTIPGPDRYGPFLWQWLHMLGARFDWDLFEGSVRYIKSILADADLGCNICRTHFRSFLAQYPYQKVKSAVLCGVWSWHAHNQATNQKTKGSKQQMPYDKAAVQYGWKPLTGSEVEQTLKQLKRQ